ncbi:transcriptional regulator, AsnC family [[Clostridium] cellulosi]|jgi:transcriptional regulator, AsnC family|uniref:Transcriptional regulator, AsnC family n=1 Tax=[Clostridium] cellulosi TaxID=29343 RepID=A0A078KPP1_9FIRM|nr:MAG: Lrp/AsnC family transcriptional regulator [[Clostridium] cellulosi]CDZ24487.1 transcriptional regulator, AsnC family [[Clostridium] cellulosi]
MDKLLSLIEENAKLSDEQLAAMLNRDVEEVRRQIREYEKSGLIKGYKALIDWEKADKETVTAFIEVKVSPQRDYGFEQVAERIMQFEEVESVYLMSGGFDLAVTVRGNSFKEVAMFVAERLSPLDNVLSTATHFILRRYKDKGVVFGSEKPDERGRISLC